ncbi:Dynactin subunit 2, partial [Phlyctochytrium bullatum]
ESKELFETPDVVATDPIIGTNTAARSSLYGLEDADYDDEIDEEEDLTGDLEIVKGTVPVTVAASRFETGGTDSKMPGSRHAGRQVYRKLRRKAGPQLPEREDYVILLPQDRYEPETKIQRLRRLMFEVEQLGADLSNGMEEVPLHSEAGDQVEAASTGFVVDEKKPTESKRGRRSHRLLVQQVDKLQEDLNRIALRVEGGLDISLFSDGDVAVGSLLKQVSTQQTLIAHLNSYREKAVKGTPNPPQSAPESMKSEDKNNSVTYELYYTPENAKLEQLSKVTELEKRVTDIEKLLGVHLLKGIDLPGTFLQLFRDWNIT